LIPTPLAMPVVLVVMGVSGSGKTTVARLLADRLHWPFEEGDALHPQANVDKMHAGHPLDDADRAPWLRKIADWVAARLDAGESGVITCSALKRAYRDEIDRRGSGVVFVFLAGAESTIAARLAARQGHFMPSSPLDSQFETLEAPGPDEPEIQVDIGPPNDVVVDTLIATLGLAG
jgi:gluconokinase